MQTGSRKQLSTSEKIGNVLDHHQYNLYGFFRTHLNYCFERIQFKISEVRLCCLTRQKLYMGRLYMF